MLRKIVLVLSVALGVLAIVVATPYFAFLDRVEGQFFTSDGTAIHYTVEGEGELVVLLHGFAVNAHLNWRLPGVIDKLKSDFQVIAMDLRSHGLSSKPHDSSAYAKQMARDVVNLLDHLEIDQAHLVGYSLGGFIALKTPDRWHSVIPMGAGWEDPKPARAWMCFRRRVMIWPNITPLTQLSAILTTAKSRGTFASCGFA